MEEQTKNLRFDGLPREPDTTDEKISLLVFHREGARIYPLTEGRGVVIGRSPPVDVLIDDRTLSRQHACFELTSDDVYVEDLGSTNGTWIDGRRVTREKVAPGTQVTMGAITVAVHLLKAGESPLYRLNSHDQFLAKLEEEMSRGRAFDHPLGVLNLQAAESAIQVSHWFQLARRCFRPIDTLALYCSSTMEALLPEASQEQCLEIATAVREKVAKERIGASLLIGIAVFPSSAASAESLAQASRDALARAAPEHPIQIAETHNLRSSRTSDDDEAPIVRNPKMREIYDSARRLAAKEIPVLIQGETGTGKELLARVLHEGGGRRKHPLCCVNCAAIPPQLVESTLFGHERGAFTGADRAAIGLFEEADGGTILLDEIGEMPLPAQATLLRVLETRRIVKVGSTKERKVDVRVVASTNRDLEAMCRSGAFRMDLFYRINVVNLHVPPLRERRDEIPALVECFAKRVRGKSGQTIIDRDAMDRLIRYSWPGNVRELRNVVERGVFMARGDIITVEELPAKIRFPAAADDRDRLMSRPPSSPGLPALTSAAEPADEKLDLKTRLEQYEMEIILTALHESGNNQTLAAKRIGMPLRTLVRKLRRLKGRKKTSEDVS